MLVNDEPCDVVKIWHVVAVGSTSCEPRAIASTARANSTGTGPTTVKVRTPDDREWHQATRRQNRPNRPNPNRFNTPGIRPDRKL